MFEEAQYEYYGKFGFTKRNSLVYLGPMVRVCFLTTHNIKINYFILIAENNRNVFGIRLYIGGHFEKNKMSCVWREYEGFELCGEYYLSYRRC